MNGGAGRSGGAGPVDGGAHELWSGAYSKYFNIPPQTQGGAVETNLSLDRK